MALEVVGLTGVQDDVNRQPYRLQASTSMLVGWNTTVSGTTALTDGDFILLIHTGEPGSGVAQAPGTGNVHPSAYSTPTITNAAGTGTTTSGWVDCGYARGGNGNRQVGGIWILKWDSTLHAQTNAQITFNRTGDTFDTHVRILVVRGAKDEYSSGTGNGPTISRTTSYAIPDQNDIEWIRPTSSRWTSTNFTGNFGSVHIAGIRRSAGPVDLTLGATDVTNLFTTTTFTGKSDGTGQGGFSLAGGRQHHTTYFDMGRTSFSAFDGTSGANWTYGFPVQGGRDTNGGISLSVFFNEAAPPATTYTRSGTASFTQSASASYVLARVFSKAPTPPQFTQSASVIAESVFVKAETEQFSLFISTTPTADVSKLNRIVTEDFTFSASTNYFVGTVYPKSPTPPQFTQSASAVAESVFVKTETQQFSLFISTSPTATVSKLNRIVSEQFTFSASADYDVGAEYNKTPTPSQFTQSASAIYDVVRVYSKIPTPPQFTQSASVDYAAVFIKSETEQFSLFISGNPDATVSKLNRQLSEQFSLSATVDASVSGTFLRSGDGSFTVQIDTPEVSVSFSPTVAPPSFQQSATSVYTIARTFTRAPATPPQFTQSASVIPDVARVYNPSIDSGVARLEKPTSTYTVEYGRTALPPAVETNASAALTYNETATAVFTLKTDLSTSKVDYVKTSTQVFTLSSSSIGGRSVTPALEAAVFTFPPRTTISTIVMDRFPEVGASLTVQAPLANFITNAPELLFGINSVVALSTSKVISRTASVSFKLSDAVAAYPYQQVLQVSLNANTDTGTQLPTAVSLNSQITVRREITKIITVSGSAGTNADITGGKIQRDVESTFSFSASTDQASGSNFQVFADIDGIGTVGATLSQRLRTEADIDGVGTIGAPLLQGADIVTITEIWNVALVELGITTVTEVDSSPQAQLLSNVWNGGFRQQFLADHAFHGAKTTRSLSLFLDSSGDPVKPSGNRWSNAYELPSDYIRALTINGLVMQPNNSMGQNAWEIEIVSNGSEPPTLKRCLLSNENSVSLEYIMDIGNDNISLLSPLVAHACGLALAAHVATNFGKNPSEQQQLNQKAQDALLAAKGVDGQESSPRMFSTTSLLDVRR